jgi:hypothetical protein
MAVAPLAEARRCVTVRLVVTVMGMVYGSWSWIDTAGPGKTPSGARDWRQVQVV